MDYYIAVEVEPLGPISDLANSLQRAYDRGAAGDFKVLVTHAPTYLVVFKRSVADDAEYVSRLADSPELSIEKAAMHQLAEELAKGDLGPIAQSVIDVLNEGDAQCFDFGVGAFEAMAESTTEHK